MSFLTAHKDVLRPRTLDLIDLRNRLLVELQRVRLPVDVLVGPAEADVVQGDYAVPLRS